MDPHGQESPSEEDEPGLKIIELPDMVEQESAPVSKM